MKASHLESGNIDLVLVSRIFSKGRLTKVSVCLDYVMQSVEAA